MEETSAPAGAPRKLGELLAASLTLAKSSAPESAVILLAAMAPAAVLMAAALYSAGATDSESWANAIKAGPSLGVMLPVIGAGIVSALLNSLAFVAVILAVWGREAGQPLDAATAYRLALERFWAFLTTEALAGVFTLLGLLLLIVPGVILAIRYCLSHLAVLIEGRRGMAALRRSQEIVVARMGKVVGNLLAATLVVVLASAVVTAVIGLALSVPKAILPGGSSFPALQAMALIKEWAAAVVRVWSISFSILLYKDLSSLHPAATAGEGQ